MSKSKKIIDNPTSAELLKQFAAFESLEALYKAFPFARKIFPKMEDAFNEFIRLRNKQKYWRYQTSSMNVFRI